MLTKKECLEALNEIENDLCELEEYRKGVTVCCLYDESLDKLIQVINEHFDNPPLKFEELEEGMWIWDNKEKRYSKIESFAGIQIYFYDYTDDFEENRFYRKQLKY